MSTTTTPLNLKDILVGNLRQVLKAYVSDFGHIPEAKQNESPMGKARTALDFTVECVGFNLWVGRTLSGEGSDPAKKPERQAFLDSLKSGTQATAALRDSVDKIIAALSALSDDELMRDVAMPWGAQAKLHEAVATATSHMTYHMGQLNYIQSLYGDDQLHWTSE